jgi:predicted AAA+ superfamily ATPase
LLHYFLGIQDETSLDVHPARGLSWEAFIMDQLISAFQRSTPGSQAFFWRTAQGDEVDLLMDIGGKPAPFEIRLHSAPAPEEAQGLRRCMQDLGLSREYVIYRGSRDYSLGGGIIATSASSLLSRPQDVHRL